MYKDRSHPKMPSSEDTPVSKLALFCSLVLVAIPGIIAIALQPLGLLLGASAGADAELPVPESQLRISIVVNSTILVSVTVLIGVYLTHTVQLRAPVVEALLRGRSVAAVFKHQVPPAVVVGSLAAGALVVYGWCQERTFPEFVHQWRAAGDLSMLARVLYGGVVEEILCRWGLMSLFVWLGWRLVQHGSGKPRAGVLWTGIVAAALLFWVGHLPLAYAHGLNTPLWICVIIGVNAVLGAGFGWLFWQRGLESAMLAHALAHVLAVMVSTFHSFVAGYAEV